jgi:sn-glycerol 3-phosphate transport system ATP-binding protein
MAEVKLSDVRKTYGTVPVIHGVDLDIADGEFIVLVGPSGCGKSTLLRMVAGLEEITAGDIAIGGRLVNNLEPKDRDVAMVFQNYALYPHMTVFGNMAYGLKIRGLSKADIAARVDKAAAILQIGHLLERRPRQLSGGQRQRVAMGRAIVREPAVFLFDEPLSNLDAKLRVQMRLEIRKLHRSLGVTSIYVTHDQVEAMTLADRLVVMNAGVAEQIGTPKEVYERPATQYVAGFIGSPAMNFIPVQVAGNGLVLPGGATLRVPLPPAHGDGQAVFGIRPEHLQVAAATGPDTFPLTVEVVEELGADTLVYGRVGEAEVTVRLPGLAPIAAGTLLHLRPEPGALHFFHHETGTRL